MTTSTQQDNREIVRSLRTVRNKLRRTAVLEGLFKLIALAGILFWVGLLADWFFEPSVKVRLAVLAAAGIFAAVLAYQRVLRPLFARINNKSIALLLERRFGELGDHLLTAVDSAEGESDESFDPALIDQSRREATAVLSTLEPGRVVNTGPLRRIAMIATVLVSSIGIFGFMQSDAFAFWIQRLSLDESPWPRSVHLQVVGFPINSDGHRVEKVAQDDSFELQVQSLFGESWTIPEEVEIRYRLPDGRRGRDSMTQIGSALRGRDEFQLFRYEFKDLKQPLELEIVGGDDRVKYLRLEIVARPQIVSIEANCLYPDYLNMKARTLQVASNLEVPVGTPVTISATSSKPLQSATLTLGTSEELVNIPVSVTDSDPTRFTATLPALLESRVVEINVTDTDGVTNRRPYRFSLRTVADETPEVHIRTTGVGTAITEQAMIPLSGTVADEHGLERIWLEFRLNDEQPKIIDISNDVANKRTVPIESIFNMLAIAPESQERMLIAKPKDKLTLTVKATDNNNLQPAEDRIGRSALFAFDVVTVSELRLLLDRQELMLRQRFETVVSKTEGVRQMFETLALETKDATDKERLQMRLAGATQTVAQVTQESLGIAEGFHDIYSQLVNNRLESNELKERLLDDIASPLGEIAANSLPNLKQTVQNIGLSAKTPEELAKSTQTALLEIDQVLASMQQILDRMLELETYNEVVGLLRDIITEQEALQKETSEKKKSALRDLLDE